MRSLMQSLAALLLVQACRGGTAGLDSKVWFCQDGVRHPVVLHLVGDDSVDPSPLATLASVALRHTDAWFDRPIEAPVLSPPAKALPWTFGSATGARTVAVPLGLDDAEQFASPLSPRPSPSTPAPGSPTARRRRQPVGFTMER